MNKDKRSFFERLTGAVHVDDYENDFPEEPTNLKINSNNVRGRATDNFVEEPSSEGQLPVDVFETENDIVIKTMIAGVRPEDLDVSITRDLVTIRGKREGESAIETENFFHQELYWGSFSRSIVLPSEIETEEAEAIEKHGLLIIRLPKINKNKQTKLKIKSN